MIGAVEIVCFFCSHWFMVLSLALGAEEFRRFAPAKGKVLVFAGQDNASVGTEKYDDGYVENQVCHGCHSLRLLQGWANEFKRFPIGETAGLNRETEWASGPASESLSRFRCFEALCDACFDIVEGGYKGCRRFVRSSD